jgi:hypothetical protein
MYAPHLLEEWMPKSADYRQAPRSFVFYKAHTAIIAHFDLPGSKQSFRKVPTETVICVQDSCLQTITQKMQKLSYMKCGD